MGVDLSAENINDLSFEKCLEKLNKARTLWERENGVSIGTYQIKLRLSEIALLERTNETGRNTIAIMFHIGRGKWFNIIPTEQQAQILFNDLRELYEKVNDENTEKLKRLAEKEEKDWKSIFSI